MPSAVSSAVERYAGLMSGTSLDGVDGVVVEFQGDRGRLVASAHIPYPDALRAELRALCQPGDNELERSALAAQDISRLYAETLKRLLQATLGAQPPVRAAGCHGQTVRHRPERRFSLQLLAPALVAELTGVPVVADFRSRDLAAGGQGAPLVPAFHRAQFGQAGRTRAVVNIGGIANVSVLRADGGVLGFDTGPGNVLLDAWCQRHRGWRFDAGGAWASAGRPIPALLDRLLEDPYFRAAPPKSTGRERFNETWLEGHLRGNERPEDVQATLLQLTAESVAAAIETACPDANEVYLCGGGARNSALVSALRGRLAPRRVELTDVLGIDVEWVEAAAFAWLARAALLGLPGNVPEATGAAGPRVLGAIYPA